MSEIQSAEYFANMIYLFKNIIGRNDKGLISDIRARDKAIVERIRERLGLIIMPDTMIEAFYSKAIDDVLRELGGEQ